MTMVTMTMMETRAAMAAHNTCNDFFMRNFSQLAQSSSIEITRTSWSASSASSVTAAMGCIFLPSSFAA